MESLAVKFMASDAFQFIAIGIVGAMVAMFNAWIKQVVDKVAAWRELRKNPLCVKGANLVEFRDAANRVLLSNCTITRFRYGVIILTSKTRGVDMANAFDYDKDPNKSKDGMLVLTCREYKAGYAIYKV